MEELEQLFVGYRYNRDYPERDLKKGSFAHDVCYWLNFSPYTDVVREKSGASISIEKDFKSGNFYFCCLYNGGHCAMERRVCIRSIDDVLNLDRLIYWYSNFGENFGM